MSRADLKDQVLRLLDGAGDIHATGLHAKLDAGVVSYQGLCRILRQLEAEGLAVPVDGYWRSMGTHKRLQAQHKAAMEKMERDRIKAEAHWDTVGLTRLQAGPVRLSELEAVVKRKSGDGASYLEASGLLHALGRLVEQGRATKVRGVVSLAQEPKTLIEALRETPQEQPAPVVEASPWSQMRDAARDFSAALEALDARRPDESAETASIWAKLQEAQDRIYALSRQCGLRSHEASRLASILPTDPRAQELPQELSAPPKLALEDVLVPSLPVLKRCASTARGSVCGTEAHTEDEVEALFGWRTVGPKRYIQGQCRTCKAAQNVVHGKSRTARRSQERAQDQQLDLTKTTASAQAAAPPVRLDYFARLRSITALVIDGQWVGEGLTTSRPPKLDAGDPERLLVTCDAGALRCALSPPGEWTVRAEESPKATPAQLAAWVRAAAVVLVALDLALASLAQGDYIYWLADASRWIDKIKAAREEVKP